ncbi:MAG: phospholipid carrier-dependent glycosyltransferase [Chloroflexi bacterium]|nr:phospholipid carrier-dependent glycosyltransferase [Chloroflexota bacterium]
MRNLTFRDGLLLVALTVLALAVRLVQLDSVPPGLHHDEAQNGLDARYLLESGERPIYIGTRFNGEPILQYAIMVSESVLGMTPVAVRFPSALFGALTVPLLYLLALELFRQGGASARAATRQAAIAAFVLATIYWHVNASREGYKPILVPLFSTLSFLLLLYTFRPAGGARPTGWRDWIWPVSTGIVLGVGFYTYPSIRFMYIIVALYVLLVLWRDRAQWRRPFARASVAAVVAALVFAPLAFYYVQHPAAFFTRSDQVAVWATRPGQMTEAIMENAGKVAGMFIVAGDSNPRHNLPARPALDWGLSAGFLLGLALVMRRATRPPYLLVILWLLIMLVPSVVTEAAPNFLRTLGAAAPTALLIGWGLGAVIDRAQRIPRLTPVALLLVSALLLASAAQSLNAYFNVMPRDPRIWYAFDVGLVKIGDVVRGLPAGERVYLSPFDSGQASIQFALGAARPDFKWFDGRKCLVAPPPDRPATMLIVSEDFRTLGHLREYWPQGTATRLADDFAGKEYLSMFRVPAQVWNNVPRAAVGKTFGGQMTLTGYTLLADRLAAGQGIPTVLFWRAQQPMQTAYTVFAQLVGPTNPRTGTPLWGQYDNQPCAGGYPTTRWDPAETLVHDFLIVVDKETPAGTYQIVVGAYDLKTGVRLTLSDGSDHVTIGPVEVQRP